MLAYMGVTEGEDKGGGFPQYFFLPKNNFLTTELKSANKKNFGVRFGERGVCVCVCVYVCV